MLKEPIAQRQPRTATGARELADSLADSLNKDAGRLLAVLSAGDSVDDGEDAARGGSGHYLTAASEDVAGYGPANAPTACAALAEDRARAHPAFEAYQHGLAEDGLELIEGSPANGASAARAAA